MSIQVFPLEEEPPSTSAQRMAAQASNLLLYFLCAAPIALHRARQDIQLARVVTAI